MEKLVRVQRNLENYDIKISLGNFNLKSNLK